MYLTCYNSMSGAIRRGGCGMKTERIYASDLDSNNLKFYTKVKPYGFHIIYESHQYVLHSFDLIDEFFLTFICQGKFVNNLYST